MRNAYFLTPPVQALNDFSITFNGWRGADLLCNLDRTPKARYALMFIFRSSADGERSGAAEDARAWLSAISLELLVSYGAASSIC